MTTPSGNIIFNNAGGLDTAASGLGPATAETGAGASTDGTAVVTGITTTGVSAGDLLWVQTASGRQFSIIASVDSGTQVTCDDTFVLGSGQTWAIGGQRKTIGNTNSQLMFADAHDDWTIELEDDQSISAAITWSGGDDSERGFRLIGTAGSIKSITQTASSTAHFSLSGASCNFNNIKFLNSAVTQEVAVLGGSGANEARFHDCICGEGSGGNNPSGFCRRGTSGLSMTFFNCIADHCTDVGFGSTNTRGYIVARNCKAIGCTSHGFATRGDGDVMMHNCISDSNGGDGVNAGATETGSVFITNCVFRNNTGDGFGTEKDDVHFSSASIVNCQITENGAYGISWPNWIGNPEMAFFDGNNFGTGATANTSGDYQGVTGGSRDTAVDPAYADTANGDYTPGTTEQLTAGYPEFTIDTTSVSSNQPIGVVGGSATGGGATLASDARIERLK